ncbi:MAG: hypothetical protein H6712_31340 [Myxococcales bacterium]|nr:hypothetical protein [Myxococcales bacterium]
MQVARGWLASEAWGLLMLGNVGRGKSQAAAWLYVWMRQEALREAQAPGVYRRAGDVLWLRAPLLARLDYRERADVLSRCARAYGLVVDELGGEADQQGEALSDMLEERGDAERRTVITTNLERAMFGDRYGDRLADRLRAGGRDEHGGARWVVEIGGESLRGLSSEEIERLTAAE